MDFYKKVTTKDLITQSLYILLNEKSIEKITIKQICDKAGIIRGTFYHHFYDKYEALEYLTYKLLSYDEYDTSDLIEYRMLLKHILITIESEKKFFVEVFKIEGQNSFFNMLMNVISDILNEYIDKRKLCFDHSIIDREFFTKIYSHQIVSIIQMWIVDREPYDANQIYEIFELLYDNRTKDIFNKLENNGE